MVLWVSVTGQSRGLLQLLASTTIAGGVLDPGATVRRLEMPRGVDGGDVPRQGKRKARGRASRGDDRDEEVSGSGLERES